MADLRACSTPRTAGSRTARTARAGCSAPAIRGSRGKATSTYRGNLINGLRTLPEDIGKNAVSAAQAATPTAAARASRQERRVTAEEQQVERIVRRGQVEAGDTLPSPPR